jgi:hypothetical protein
MFSSKVYVLAFPFEMFVHAGDAALVGCLPPQSSTGLVKGNNF